MIDPLATNLVYQPLKFSRNRLDVLIDAADTTLTDRSSLRYALTLLVPTFPQSTDFEELTTLTGRERPPQTVGGLERFDGAQFRIDEVLDGFLETQKPTFWQTAMGIIPSMTMPFYRREEVSGGTPAVAISVERAKEWVFKGGLTNEDFAGWGDRFFDRYLRDTRQFLTWQPSIKTVSIGQEEYVYFLLNASPVPALVKRRLEVTFQNGIVETFTTGTLTGAGLFQVVNVPAGLVANGLDETVASYKLWLADQDDQRISEVRTFLVDTSYQAQERFLLIENSLSGFDTIRLLGQGSQSTSVRRTLVETDDVGASQVDFASLRVVNVEGDSTLTVSTGYFKRSAVDWLRYLDEILLTKSIYLSTEKGHVPYVLTTTELVVDEDDAELIARTLTFRKAKTETNFSFMPPTPPQPARPTGWRGIGFRHVLDSVGKRTGLGAPIRLRKFYTDDLTDVKPIVEKANAQGNADYINPTPIPGVVPGSTPFPSAEINRPGTYRRSTCPSGQTGGPGSIVIAAGKYGGEAQADSNSLAEAEFKAIDTQAYADQHGACSVSENYSWNVPAGQWHLRFSHPEESAIFHNDGNNGPADMGNTQSLQGQGGAFIYPTKSNDLNFPIGSTSWFIYSLGTPYQNKRMKAYKNGQLYQTMDFTRNKDGFELLSLFGGGGAPASGDLYFLKFEDR